MVRSWENLRRFLWCWSSFCCSYSSFVSVLHSHFLSDIIPHPSVDYRQFLNPFCTFSPAHRRVIRDTFILWPFHYLLTASGTVLRRHFLPKSVFYLTLLPDIFGTFPTFWHTSFYQGFTGSRQLISWKLQGFILILKTQTRSICLFDSQ